jgi:carboxyl-terminal processing protease
MSDANTMLKTIEKLHVDYKEMDKKASEFIYNNTIQSIDKYGLFYTQEDIQGMDKYKFILGTTIAEESEDFLNELHSLYKTRQNETVKILKQLKGQEFDFEALDTFYYSEKSPSVPKQQIIYKWQRWLKLVALREYTDQLDSAEMNISIDIDRINRIKDTAIEEQIKTLEERIVSKDYVYSRIKNSFLSSLAQTFDPHSDYFSPKEREEFNESLSATKHTFGLEIDMNDDNEIEITSIIPGSSAWNSDQFQIGDIILSFRPKGKKEIDFSNISLAKARTYLSSDKVEEGKFKLKKSSGQQENLDLVKSFINNDDNLINSYLIESTKKMAYIALPSFYNNNETGNGCANDIAKELIQLKKEGIEGLIFDLRGNGGGSLEEALKLCGMFINHGALFIFKYREGDPETVKDLNKGSVYDGPMILLVDKSSCSAAELFAAVMQDYNRAVIVGGDTYGKSTCQTILPLNANSVLNDPESLNTMKDYLKLTIGQMYRCTGKSYQKEGVKADIYLPDIYKYLDIGESNEPRALSAKTIDKKTYYYPLPALPIEDLKKKSQLRLIENKRYKELEDFYAVQAVYLQNKWIPVYFEGFKKFIHSMENAEQTTFKSENSTLDVRLPEHIVSLGKQSEAHQQIRELRCKELKQDLNILEAYYILNDLNLLTK